MKYSNLRLTIFISHITASFGMKYTIKINVEVILSSSAGD